MAITICQGLIYFTDKDAPQGWTESFYRQDTVSNTIAALQILIPYRKAFLSKDNQMVAIRASVINANPRSTAKITFATPVSGIVPVHNYEPGNAIVMNFRGVNGSVHNCLFRGVSDQWIAGDTLTSVGVSGLNQINAYLSLVGNNGWANRQPDRGTSAAPIRQIVTGKNSALGSNITLLLQGTAPEIQNGSVVRVRGFNSMKLINGLWKATNVQTVAGQTSVDLAGSTEYAPLQIGRATVQLVVQGLDPFQTYGFVGISFRKCGRPFGLRRGKISSRVLHH